VQQLITHTSGLGYWFWSTVLLEWEKTTGIPNVVAGVRSSLTAPLLADPGTAFIYGINTDWLGQVVEAVTGSPGCGHQAGHHRPARHGPHHVPDER
jgi:methyl acetate hydrolase